MKQALFAILSVAILVASVVVGADPTPTTTPTPGVMDRATPTPAPTPVSTVAP